MFLGICEKNQQHINTFTPYLFCSELPPPAMARLQARTKS